MIEVDITDLDLGDTLMVEDLKLPEGVEPVTSLETAIVSILAPTKGGEEEEEEVEGTVEGETPTEEAE